MECFNKSRGRHTQYVPLYSGKNVEPKHAGGVKQYKSVSHRVGEHVNYLDYCRRKVAKTLATISAITVATITIPTVAYAASLPHVDNNVKIQANNTTIEPTTVSRDYYRPKLSTLSTNNEGLWGNIEQLTIPITRSTSQKEAANSLDNMIKSANNTLSNYGIHADKSMVDSLKQEISKAQNVLKDENSSINALNDTTASLGRLDANVRNNAIMRASVDSVLKSFSYKMPEGTSPSDAVNLALQFVGKTPYVWGGNQPYGWDCSGMVQWVYGQLGVRLPHYSGSQATVGTPVKSILDAKPGDIIANNTHAAIYVGNGLVVNALSPELGTQVTPISYAFMSAYQIRRVK